MHRRIEAGPVLVALGALLLVVSLFLDWYAPGVTAWTAFEIIDLALAVLAIAAAAGAIGLLAPSAALLERRWLPPLVVAAIVLAAFALLDPPPAVADEAPDTGAWLALAGALVMGVGALLTFGRVSFAVTVEGRDPRRRVAAYDARGGAGGSSTAPFNPFSDEEAAQPSDAYGTRPPLSSRRSMSWRPGTPAPEAPGADATGTGGDDARASAPRARPWAGRARAEGGRPASARGGVEPSGRQPEPEGGRPARPRGDVDPSAEQPDVEGGPSASAGTKGEGGVASGGRAEGARPAAASPDSGAAAPEEAAAEGAGAVRAGNAPTDEAPRARRRRGSWLEPEEDEPAEPRRPEEPGPS